MKSKDDQHNRNPYPPLVEDAYRIMTSNGAQTTRLAVFNDLISKGILNHQGEPTKKAIDQGLVCQTNTDAAAIAEMKNRIPVYQLFDDHHFHVKDGEVMVDSYVVKRLAQATLANQDASEQSKEYARLVLNQIESREQH